jgi:Arc/MetJ family transcription regulator
MCIQRCIPMRTNVVIDDKLIQEALRLSKLKTKKELIHKALEEFIQNRKRLDLREVRGKIRFAEGYDYKKMRTR